MNLLVLLRLGVRSLKLHKLRSSLSILGVVFGVAAVVAMSSVGEGARRKTLAEIEALEIDTVTVRLRGDGAEPRSTLPAALADSVGRVVPGVRAVAPARVAELRAEAGGRSAAGILAYGIAEPASCSLHQTCRPLASASPVPSQTNEATALTTPEPQ